MTPVIDITIDHEAWCVIDDIEGLVERAVAAALAESRPGLPAETELSVVLCDDAFIQGLNAQWRGRNTSTNVLSFPVDTGAKGPALGDIVIAFETSAREAEEEHRTLSDHLSHLVVHGTLHLLGFDHEDDQDAEAMEGLESRTLESLGIASPYESAAEPGVRA